MAKKSVIFLCLISTHISLYCFSSYSYSKSVEYEGHMAVLNESNFRDFIGRNKFAMVVFYAPWCEFSQALAPEYAAAAAELKDEAVVLAKVDATVEVGLSNELDVHGFPTIHFFLNGNLHRSYYGQRIKDYIVSWLKKKITRGLNNITIEEVGDILMDQDKIVLGYLDSLVGRESEELAAVASMLKEEYDVSFYQTTSPDVARLFNVDIHAKRPSLVFHFNKFSGRFTKSAIAEFVYENMFTLTNLEPDSAPTVFNNPINKQMIPSAKSICGEAAKLLKEMVKKLLIDLF